MLPSSAKHTNAKRKTKFQHCREDCSRVVMSPAMPHGASPVLPGMLFRLLPVLQVRIKEAHRFRDRPDTVRDLAPTVTFIREQNVFH